MLTNQEQIEWFKGRFHAIQNAWINTKGANTFTTVKLNNGATATVSHVTFDSNAELGLLWAYVKVSEKHWLLQTPPLPF
jgi:protein subunit release factor B